MLLSDGGAQDAAAATQQAQLLKDQGVFLITVALPGARQCRGCWKAWPIRQVITTRSTACLSWQVCSAILLTTSGRR
ncbi:MAG: hypothetical protein HZY76_22775 [Anaerolineae bacterium]|nr:MAG: hypothetical protein HZY76_22775 [Anaerolineae bacterium]